MTGALVVGYVGLFLWGMVSKRSLLHGVLCVLFLAALAALNTDAADLSSVYLPIFDNPDLFVGQIEPGWLALCRWGGEAGLTYNGLAALLIALSTAALFAFAWRCTKNASLYTSLFLIYPGLISLVQIRQYVASVLVLWAMYLLSRRSLRGWVGYLALMALAISVHQTAVVALSCAAAPFIRRLGRHARWAAGAVGAAAIVIVGVQARAWSIAIFGSYRTDWYLGEVEGGSVQVSQMGAIRNVVLLVGVAGLVWILGRIAWKDRSVDRSLVLEIIVLNLALLAIVPFVVISNDFLRFERYGFTAALVLMASAPYAAERRPLLSSRGLSAAVTMAVGYSLVYVGSFDAVVRALLSFEYLPQLLR